MTTYVSHVSKKASISQLSTVDLKDMAMKLSGSPTTGHKQTFTKVVKTLASRLKASPKKIRRQARTKFWN